LPTDPHLLSKLPLFDSPLLGDFEQEGSTNELREACLTPARRSSLEAQSSQRRMVSRKKNSEAPKMLNQASIFQHFLIPTASNGSPLKILLRRDFARGGSLELTGRGVRGERPRSRRPHSCQCSARGGQARIGSLLQRPLSDPRFKRDFDSRRAAEKRIESLDRINKIPSLYILNHIILIILQILSKGFLCLA
jgi:hypothetical protein